MKGRWLVVPTVAVYATRTLRVPLAGWSLTGEAQGVGPVTRRVYWIDIASPRRPETEVVTHLLQHLPEMIPPVLAAFRRVRRGGGPTGVGDRFTVLMLGVRRGRVQVVEVGPTHFRLQTLRQHSESGWIEFRSEPLTREPQAGAALTGDSYRLTVVSQVRASSWYDRATYLLGVGILQRMTWESGLRRALKVSGGRMAGHGTTTVEWP